MDLKQKLEGRLETIRKEGEGLERQYNDIAKQRNELNRKLAGIQDHAKQLQGQYAEVSRMLKEECGTEAKPIETPKKEDKKAEKKK